MSSQKQTYGDSGALYRRLLTYIAPYKAVFAVSVIAMAVTALSEAAFAALFKPIMDSGFVEPDSEFIAMIPWLIIGIVVVRSVAGFMANYTMSWVGRQVVFDLRRAVFDRMLHLPSSFYDRYSSATLVSKLIYDVEQTAIATTDALTLSVKDLFTALALVGWMLYLDWVLTLTFLVFAPLIGLGINKAAGRFRKSSESIQDSMTGIAQIAKETVNGHQLVKTFGAQQYETEAFERVNQYNRRQTMRKAAVAAAMVPMVVLVMGAALALIISIALERSGAEAITAGAFVSYLAAVMMLMAPIKRLAKINEKIQMGVASAHSMFGILDEETEQDTGRDKLEHPAGEIVFDGVSFAYEHSRFSAVRDIDIHIRPGERVALVGPSGSGKSTLASLLLGFYRPLSGVVRLDARDIGELTLANLRRQIAIVSQETLLFDGTIRSNILYGAPTGSEQRLQEVVKAAHVAEFVERLPKGLETPVGERGARLSGGQRQRIAIARALYKGAPILILDEATSSLDSVSERLVQQATENLAKNRTNIVIAHRLFTVENADRIFVLNEGSIVEEGNHRDLIEQDSLYARLYQTQKMEEQRIAV
ncbi:MAG: Lipid A export ATP-binding/permease protein MsbA [Gammaproteobacteria bacterium]|nr:Lipid A export ATP-binding/permease protein MsbA [Gammaproteobacteria bacterium]